MKKFVHGGMALFALLATAVVAPQAMANDCGRNCMRICSQYEDVETQQQCYYQCIQTCGGPIGP